MNLSRRNLLIGAAGLSLGQLPPRQPTTITREIPVSKLPPALFVACHPDDETLTMGVPIAEHAQLGQDVHVLFLTRGTGSGVINRLNGTHSKPSKWWGVLHDPAAEGYAPLTLDEFGAARLREATNALGCLGEVTIHEAGLQDGKVTQADAEDAVLAVADAINPGGPVRLKSHSDVVEDHPDHLAAGAAMRALSHYDPGRFSDRRFHVLPRFWSDSRLSQVKARWDNPDSAEIAARVVNACRAYAAWSPPDTFAVGMHSTPQLFAPLLERPRALYHK